MTAAVSPARPPLTLWLLVVLAWAGNAAYAAGVPGGPLKFWSPAIVAGAMIAFLWLHGVQRYGRALVARFVAIVFAVGWIAETVSLLTGLPFGKYHYTEYMWPFIGHVPVFVLPAYAIMGYASWSLATILAGQFTTGLDGRGRWQLPLLGAALMVAWDLSMDPLRATVEGRWIWPGGGSYLGVPAANFVGWFVVTWLMFALFARAVHRRHGAGRPIRAPRGWWVCVPAIYLAFPVEYLLNPLVGGDGVQVAMGGETVAAGKVFATVAMVTLFTMVPASLAGLARLGGIGGRRQAAGGADRETA